ncbi:HET-domain-containing protein [Xylaria sp. FL1777]|nr:HET-domain-containing protein [Xylaria sp. FL1777]
MKMSIQYLDLNRDRREIRLLQLLPCTGGRYARIPCCRLLHASLREAPRYDALSYAWGDANPNRVIIIDDIPILIPQNLFNALITLRPQQAPILIWADYLCINQQNVTEKTWQVAMMRDIYVQANEVLVWLGPGDSESQRAIEYLEELGEEAYSCGFYHNEHIGELSWRRLATLYSTHRGDPPDSIATRMKAILEAEFRQHIFASTPMIVYQLGNLFHKINGWSRNSKCFPIQEMKNILKRQWFERVWVLQEIAVSKKAKFICGTKSIDRVKFTAAMNVYRCFWTVVAGTFQVDGGMSLTPYHAHIFRETFFRATMMANAHRIERSNFPLIALLRLTCVGSSNLQKHGPHHLDSSNPCDKIFALLGLASDRKDLSKRGVDPDYTKSALEVYTLTTSALLQQGHLALLSLIQPHKKSIDENLPSWVPDWCQPFTAPLQIVLDDHMTLYPEFGASGTKNSATSIKVNRNASGICGISLEGYVCDKVHSVGLFPRRKSSWDVPLEETYSWPQEWLVEILRLSYQTKDNFPSFQERLHAVARASVGGVTHSVEGDVIRTGGDILVKAIRLLRKSIRRINVKRIKLEAQKFLAHTGDEMASDSEIVSLMGTISGDINGRSLKRLPFVTTTGRLGLGYDCIQAGDVVAIIRGAQVPFILRRQQTGAYNLISEAYVDGIMDGEALQGATLTWLDIV